MESSRQEHWRGLPFPSPVGSSWLRDWTQASHFAGRLYRLSPQGGPGQGRRWWTKNYKDLHSIRIKKKMVKKRRGIERSILGPLDLMTWEESVYLDVGYFLVNLIFKSSAFAQNQIASGALFSCEICTQGLIPGKLAAVSVVKNTR